MRTQYVKSAPAKVLVGEYTTKSGQKKNRYKANPNSHDVRTVIHYD